MREKYTLLSILLLLVLLISSIYGDFTFVVLGDRTGGHIEGIYGEVIDKTLSEDANFYITVGDQIEGYTDDPNAVQEEWDEFFSIVDEIPNDLYLLAGNHDIWDDQSENIWVERTGNNPDYSFNYEGVHFTMLDTSRWESSDSLPDEHYEWLESDLSEHKDAPLTFVFFHKPLWYNTLAEGEDDRLHDIFVQNGVDAVFSGHFHTYGSAIYDGITYTMVGSSGGRMSDDEFYKGHFYHYGVVEVSDGDFNITIVPLEGEERYNRDVVKVSDLKFFEKIYSEYIVLNEFYVDTPQTDREKLSIVITNPYEEQMETEITWNLEDTDWSVEPDEFTVEIPQNSTSTLTFNADYEELYPLPEVSISYPYGENELYEHTVPPHITRTLTINQIKPANTPRIDGKLGHIEWIGATSVESFCSPEGGEVTIEDTSFYFGYDDENLYIQANCGQEGELMVNAEERDGAVWLDDCVGFFLSPGGLEGDIYQIYFNPDGVIFDQRIFTNEEGQLDGDTGWNVECEVATAKGDGWWMVEIAFPFTALETDAPEEGDVWRVNFRRKEMSVESSADWQYPISYDVNYFGRMVFE